MARSSARTLTRFEKRAVNDKIGVTANRRCEMGVMFLRETVMAERFNGVTGAHQ
jgi:hypothetical protein